MSTMIHKRIVLSLNSTTYSCFMNCQFMSTDAGTRHFHDGSMLMTPSEVTRALRPFYFAVHPDRFMSTPNERQINENSLKIFNEYLDVMKDTSHGSRAPVKNVNFYLKDVRDVPNKLIPVKINLQNDGNINNFVDKILKSCKLSTDYLDQIGKRPSKQTPSSTSSLNVKTKYHGHQAAFWMNKNVDKHKEKYQNFSFMDEDEINEYIKRDKKVTLTDFLSKNVDGARTKSKTTSTMKNEIFRLKFDIKKNFNIKDIIWHSEWNSFHALGALSALEKLLNQNANSEFLNKMQQKTIIFGNKTGINFNGAIMLSTEDVRQNWLRLLKNISKFDLNVEKVPFYEQCLSAMLFNIKISHRKYNSDILINSYIEQLSKLSSSITDFHQTSHHNVSELDLSKHKLVVESDAGPLMLSPTGQFICPSSCPASLLIEFIETNLENSSKLIFKYKNSKKYEEYLISRTILTFNLSSLTKDDNVTPDLMNGCIENLLNNQFKLRSLMNETNIRISKYYSVNESGEICIPFDFVI